MKDYRMRRIGAMLALCFGAVGTAAAWSEGWNDAYHYSNASLPSQTTWMSTLDDATPLNRISIPGTHASGGAWHDNHNVTQTLSLRQQLEAGIRFLDLGVREQAGTTFVYHKGRLQAFHLQGAFIEIASFLHEYPSETVFVRLYQDEDAINGWGHALPRLVNRYREEFAHFSLKQNVSANVPLRDLRGKIVWLREIGVDLPGLDYTTFARQEHGFLDTHWSLYSKWEKVKAQFDATNKAAGTVPAVNNLWSGGGVPFWFTASGRIHPDRAPRMGTHQYRPFSNPFPDFPCPLGLFPGFLCQIEYEGTNWLSRERMGDANLQYAGFVVADFPGHGLIKRTIDINRTNSMMVNDYTKQCIDIEGGAAQGRRALAWTCHGGANQRVTVRGNEVRIGGRCLDVEGSNVYGQILLWDCHGGPNQRWTVEASGRLRSHLRGGVFCLTQSDRNTPMSLAHCGGTNAQRFVARR